MILDLGTELVEEDQERELYTPNAAVEKYRERDNAFYEFSIIVHGFYVEGRFARLDEILVV
jgi:hypothetical protein